MDELKNLLQTLYKLAYQFESANMVASKERIQKNIYETITKNYPDITRPVRMVRRECNALEQ
jgi:hypothetical protein